MDTPLPPGRGREGRGRRRGEGVGGAVMGEEKKAWIFPPGERRHPDIDRLSHCYSFFWTNVTVRFVTYPLDWRERETCVCALNNNNNIDHGARHWGTGNETRAREVVVCGAHQWSLNNNNKKHLFHEKPPSLSAAISNSFIPNLHPDQHEENPWLVCCTQHLPRATGATSPTYVSIGTKRAWLQHPRAKSVHPWEPYALCTTHQPPTFHY